MDFTSTIDKWFTTSSRNLFFLNGRVIITLLICLSITTIAYSQIPSPETDNDIKFHVRCFMVTANNNYETVGNNDFVFNANCNGVSLLSCEQVKIPTNPPWWFGIFDPVGTSIATGYGLNAKRSKQFNKGFAELDLNTNAVNFGMFSYEDDKGEICNADPKDDAHQEGYRTLNLFDYSPLPFSDYPTNIQTHTVKYDIGSGYVYVFEFFWYVSKPNFISKYICNETFQTNPTGNLCSNRCDGKFYGGLTFVSKQLSTFTMGYKWTFTLPGNSPVVTGILNSNNYYYKPDLSSMNSKTNIAYSVICKVERYISIGGSYMLLDEATGTITLSAVTPTYNYNGGIPVSIPPKCYNGKDGEIIVDISKISSPVIPREFQISYRVAPSGTVFGTDKHFTNDSISKRDTLVSGNYIVQIGNFIDNFSDTKVGCPLNIPVTVPIRPLLQADLDTIPYTNTDVSCRNNTDGRIRLKVSGGAPPYKVTSDTILPDANWPRIHTTPGRTGFYTFTGLSPDLPYTFAISDSFNCPLNSKRRIEIRDTLTNPDTLRFNYVLLSKYNSDTLYNTEWNVSCNGANNGSIRALVNEFTPMKNGRRYVNPPFRFWLTGTTTTGVSVFKDTIPSVSTSRDAIPNATVFNNLYAGTYTLHVLDKNGCYYSEIHTLREPPRLDISVIDFLDNKCSGEAKGMVKTKTLGGTRPYRYYKDNLNQSSTSSNPYYLCYGVGFTTTCDKGSGNYQNDFFQKTFDTIATLSNLVFGNHTMYVKDTNGCVSSVTRYVNQPTQLSVTLQGKNISCKGSEDGTLKAFGSGGTPPYSYNWSFNAQTIETTDYIDSLFAGAYQMDITDANGCKSADNSTAYAQISEPADTLKATASVAKDPTCADREDAIINIDVQGGWTPRYFSLDGIKYQRDEPNFTKLKSGMYPTIHVRDGNGCTILLDTVRIIDPGKLTATELQPSIVSCFGSTDGTIQLSITGGNKPYTAGLGSNLSAIQDSIVQLHNLAPGTYTIHIADSKKCLMDKLVIVTSPEKLQDSILHVTDASPNTSNGSATIKAFGGTSPYSYQWDLIQQNSFTGPVTMLNLSAGFKKVIITDSKRCVDTAYVGINNIGAPVHVSTVTVPPSCSYTSDGSSTVTYTAATALTYQWLHGPTGQSISGLKDGIYYLTVTDANGLIATKADTVKAPDPITILFGTKPSSCFGDCKGEIQATINGGTQPYFLQWNDPSSQTTVIAGNLCEGLYKLHITDAHSCIANDSINLLNPDPVEIGLGESATICSGQVMTLDAKNNGSTYTWTSSNPDFSANTQTIQITGDGTYYVNIVTPYGCLGSDTFQLTSSRDLLDALFYVSTKNYAGDTVAFVDVSYPTPETIEWDFGQDAILLKTEPNTQYVIFPEAGNYNVKLTAFLGECSDTLTKKIKIFEHGDTQGYANGKTASAAIKSLYVFPNPNDGSFQVLLDLNGEYESELIIHDFTGTIIKKISLEKNSHFETPFNLNQMAKGVYFVRAIAGGETLSVVVTIQ